MQYNYTKRQERTCLSMNFLYASHDKSYTQESESFMATSDNSLLYYLTYRGTRGLKGKEKTGSIQRKKDMGSILCRLVVNEIFFLNTIFDNY